MRRNPGAARSVRLWLTPIALCLLGWIERAVAQDVPANQGTPGNSIARYIPDKDLIFFAEFQGLDAHAAGWKNTATYKILNDTTFGALAADLMAQGLVAAKVTFDGKPLSGPELAAKIDRFSRQGVALAVLANARDEHDPNVMIVFRGGARPELRQVLEGMASAMSKPNNAKSTLTRRGRTLTRYGEGNSGGAVWSENDDAILCSADGIESALDALDGKQPNMLANTTRAGLAKASDGFEPAALAFLDVKKLPSMPHDAARMGLDRIQRVELRLGFQDDALMTVLRLVAPSPRKGIFALLDQPTFDLSSLPSLPAALTNFTALSANCATTFDRIVALAKASDPAAAGKIDEILDRWKKTLGIDVRADLLAHLGPKLAIYPAAVPIALAVPGAAILNVTLTVQIDDAKAVAKAVETLMEALARQLKAEAEKPGRQPGQGAQLSKKDGPRPTWAMTFPGGKLPPGTELALVVGKNSLAIALSQASADAALDLTETQGKRWSPNGAFAAMGRQVPKNLVFLNVNDPRETFPQIVSNLPMLLQIANMGMAQAAQANPGRGPARIPIEINPALIPQAGDLARLLFPGSFAVAVDSDSIRFVNREPFPSVTNPAAGGVMVGLLLPAVQAAREAARRTQCVNNMKQMALALHNYHAANDRFPRAAITDANGKPLLSWRVAILPQIGEEDLYKKFHQDEPWDSPHNKALLPLMPAVYACPSAVRPDPTLTTYRIFVGEGALLSLDKDTGVRDVTDGTSNTIAVVETKGGVPWTKPEELPFDPAKPPAAGMFGASSFHAGGLNVLFTDGSVRFLKPSIKPEVFRALITRDGGEVIQLEDL